MASIPFICNDHLGLIGVFIGPDYLNFWCKWGSNGHMYCIGAPGSTCRVVGICEIDGDYIIGLFDISSDTRCPLSSNGMKSEPNSFSSVAKI